MASSAISTVRTQLAAIWTAAGIQNFEFPPGQPTTPNYVFIGDIEASQEHLTFGGSRIESMDVEAFIYCETAGAGDTEAAAAEDAALAILQDVEDSLRTSSTLTGNVFHAQISDYRSRPGVLDGIRAHTIELSIDVEVHI